MIVRPVVSTCLDGDRRKNYLQGTNESTTLYSSYRWIIGDIFAIFDALFWPQQSSVDICRRIHPHNLHFHLSVVGPKTTENHHQHPYNSDTPRRRKKLSITTGSCLEDDPKVTCPYGIPFADTGRTIGMCCPKGKNLKGEVKAVTLNPRSFSPSSRAIKT